MIDAAGLYELMNTQRAVRRWTDEPVPDEVIRRVVEAATKAPSGSNLQPWAFVAVTDEGKRQALAEAIRTSFEQRFGGQRPDPDQIEDPVQRRMMRGAFRLFDNFAAAPVLIIPCLVSVQSPAPEGLLAGSSIYPSIQNLMLAARAEGLGTVLTTPQDGIRDVLAEVIGIPEEAVPAAIIPMGWPAADFGPVNRKPVDEFLHWDGWGGARA